jgi:hypothetical protein
MGIFFFPTAELTTEITGPEENSRETGIRLTQIRLIQPLL